MGKPSEDDDGDDVIEVTDGKAATEEEGDEEDRGDEVKPEETEENLKKKEEEEEQEPAAKGPAAVPKGRLNEVIAERNSEREHRLRLEEENARLKGAQPPKKEDAATTIDLKDLRKLQRAALMEGDEDKAATLDDQIDAELERRATVTATATISQANAKQALDDAAAAVIVDYPFLDSKSKAANKEAIDEVVAFRNSYIQAGMSPADALLKAAQKVGKFYAPKKAAAKAADDDEEQAEKAAKSKIDELKEARLRRNANAANSQAPRLDGGVGNRGTGGKVNIEDMDDETFAKLSEKEKAKYRGDVA